MGPLKRYEALVDYGELHPDAAQAQAAERLQLLFAELKHYHPGRTQGFLGLFGSKVVPPRGLYIHGGVGRGKSMLMDLFFETTHFTPKRRVHFHAFMLETHGLINEWRKMDVRSRAKHPNYIKEAGDDPIAPVARGIARDAKLLCFDEFQVSDIADAMILSRLFEALFAEGVVVVATSNRAPDALYEGGLNRQLFLPFIALLKDRLEVLELVSLQDYRLNRVAGEPVYHSPLGTEADFHMDDMWRRLTDCEKGHIHKIKVQGRVLKVPQAAMGCSRFSFADLAEKPLGAADYLAIATAYHTVFVDHIPQMNKDKRNEAKRFVTLIDALYESRVKLICSAAVEPESLYEQGDGAFEFGRTVSRLEEMQSEDYLALDHGGDHGEKPRENPSAGRDAPIPS